MRAGYCISLLTNTLGTRGTRHIHSHTLRSYGALVTDSNILARLLQFTHIVFGEQQRRLKIRTPWQYARHTFSVLALRSFTKLLFVAFGIDLWPSALIAHGRDADDVKATRCEDILPSRFTVSRRSLIQIRHH